MQKEESPELNDLMAHMALICSFASLQCQQPGIMVSIPNHLRFTAQQYVSLSAANRSLLRDLACLIDEYLSRKFVSNPTSREGDDGLTKQSLSGAQQVAYSDSDDGQSSADSEGQTSTDGAAAGFTDPSVPNEPMSLAQKAGCNTAAAAKGMTTASEAAFTASVKANNRDSDRSTDQTCSNAANSAENIPVQSKAAGVASSITMPSDDAMHQPDAESGQSTSADVGSSMQDTHVVSQAGLPLPANQAAGVATTAQTAEAGAGNNTAQGTPDSLAGSAAKSDSDASSSQAVGHNSGLAVDTASVNEVQTGHQPIKGDSGGTEKTR